MKFHLVPIGEKFTFEGEVYTKSGPIAASSEVGGVNKMIARSANVTLCNIIAPVEKQVTSKKIVPLNEVINIMGDYNAQYHEYIEQLENDFSKISLESFKNKMEDSSEEVLSKLKAL